MTLDELYHYIEQPENLDKASLPALKSLVATYPYCATLVLLYLYNLARCKDLQYTSELKRLSPYIHDRHILYQLVELGSSLKKAKKSPSNDNNDPFNLIENFLGQQRASGEDLPKELNYGLSSSDRDDYFASEVGQSSLEELKGLELDAKEPNKKKAEGKVKTEETESNSEDLDEELFTETLAKIYIKQGKYEKALRIIRSISLNYPKKNRYFANQIRFLELLVRNNKDNSSEI